MSSFKGISDLANKESSRAKEMKKILAQIGIKCKLTSNEMKIFGKGMINASNKTIHLGKLGDHRVAMCTFILALLTNAKTKIKNFETVFTSSPSLKIMKSLGLNLKSKDNFLQITCDGGASTGKSTGTVNSKKYKLAFLSSGLLYRYAGYLIIKYNPK